MLSPYRKPLAFCRIRQQSAVVLSTVSIFSITLRYFWVEDYLGKTGGVPAFLVQKKNSNNPHNSRLWRFCFSSLPVMGVSCEERNGVYLRCKAVNDRTKVRCVL